MKIKELEEQLNLSRANIRFYEKEGLLSPARTENGYREYSEAEIAILKKIIIFRKLGMSLPQIKEILNGTLEISAAVEQNIEHLKEQIAELNGALEVSKAMQKDTSVDTEFDEEHYWNLIQKKEASGEKFTDLWKDYAEIEKKAFLSMWEGSFFFRIKEKVKKYGWKSVLVLLLGICVIRGIVQELWGQGGSFLEGFGYPFFLFGTISLVTIPVFLLDRKYKNAEPEPEPQVKHPTLLGFFKGLLLFAYFLFYLFGALIIAEDIFTWILGEDFVYVANFSLYVVYYVMGMCVFALFVYFYSKHGLFPDRISGEDGIKCNIPRKKRHQIAAASVVLLIITFLLSLTWYDCFTEDGLRVRRFFYTKNYTWEEIDYYYLDAKSDGTLSYLVVMQDGTQADVMGWIVGIGNLPEDKYPDYDYDFMRYLTRKFAAQGVEFRMDNWGRLYKKLQYDSWIELAEELREIAEHK